MHRAVLLAMAGLGMIVAAGSGATRAQDRYPARPVHVVVPFPPGGINDVVARPILQKLGEAIGVAIVIENRAGAGGTIGATAAARAEADSYTLLLARRPRWSGNCRPRCSK